MKLLIFSDIHSDLKSLDRLISTEADYYFAAGDLVNFGRGLEACGEILKAKGDRVFCIPGNHETAGQIEKLCSQFGLRYFHEQSVKLGEYHVAGLGYSSPTPFDTPGEYTEEQIAAKLEPFAGLDPLILVCHAPPRSSKLDTFGGDQHGGSTAVAQFIERHQPQYFFCGHIHEQGGQSEQIGKTRAVNVGKKGYLLELN